MKSIIVKAVALIALTIALANAAFAGGGGDATKVKVNFVQHDNQMIAVHYKKPAKQVIKFKVVNVETNKIVHMGSRRKAPAAIIKYDMSNLPKGLYRVEVTSGTAKYFFYPTH